MATLVDQPRDLLLGADNDIVMLGGALDFSRGLAGIAQACRIAVQMFAEEWFLDLDVGIPYLQSILGQRSSVAILAARKAFREELLAVQGVIAIASLDVGFDAASRTLTVAWSVSTDLGNTPVDSISQSSSGGGG